MISALLISFLLIALTIAIHYECLRFTSRSLAEFPIFPRARIVVVLAFAMVSHLLQVLLYAAAFYGMLRTGGFGDIGGVTNPSFADMFYFSITSYTTLGIGDLYPHGAIRIVSGIEALNGLVLVGWTASFTYLKMEMYWQTEAEKSEGEAER